MPGETNLTALLRHMTPLLDAPAYVFCTVDKARYGDLAHTEPLASVTETEGLTLVLRRETADREHLAYQGTFRCIRLGVHSSLEAIGLTAAVATALAQRGISANVIAGYYHDYVLVPADKAEVAMQALEALAST